VSNFAGYNTCVELI